MSDFSQRFVVFDVAEGTRLPFTVSGITQHGECHYSEGFNNQDAMSLFVKEEMIIGVLCDGCSSGSDIMALNPWSFAENGAQILSALVGRYIQDLWQGQDFTELAVQLSECCKKDISSLLRLLAGKHPVLREHLLRQLCMATILAVLITSENYCVFHCGDGLVAINGNFIDLNVSSSGQYLANVLSCEAKPDMPLIEVLDTGKSETLENLLIASDGVGDIRRHGNELLEGMLSSLDARAKGYSPGADKIAFLREFRKRVATPFESLSPKSYDDRSLLMIRRIPGMTQTQKAKMQTNS